MNASTCTFQSILNDFVLPTALFMSVGFFAWAIRGTTGFGGVRGCVFAGACYAIVWLFLSRRNDPGNSSLQRPYRSGWLVIGMVIFIAVGGFHGWMQITGWTRGVFMAGVPIDPAFGYAYWIIASMPWAGLGAVAIAWTGSRHPSTPKEWVLRIVFGGAGVLIALALWSAFPRVFLPDYQTGLYSTEPTNRTITGALSGTETDMIFLGIYAGLLSYEIFRKDWRNVKLITIVGVVTAAWWVLFQAVHVDLINWKWWEESAGAGIGLGFGLAFYICNRPEQIPEPPVTKKDMEKWENVIGIYFPLCVAVTWGFYRAILGAIGNLTGTTPDEIIAVLVPIVIASTVLWIVGVRRVFRRAAFQGEKVHQGKDFYLLFLIAYWLLRIIGYIPTLAMLNVVGYELDIVYAMLTALDMMILFLIMKKVAHQAITPSKGKSKMRERPDT
jgi:hypothetical protein